MQQRARVVLLQVPNDADAYRMFETLNDRGLRTSQSDLVKNYGAVYSDAQETASAKFSYGGLTCGARLKLSRMRTSQSASFDTL